MGLLESGTKFRAFALPNKEKVQEAYLEMNGSRALLRIAYKTGMIRLSSQQGVLITLSPSFCIHLHILVQLVFKWIQLLPTESYKNGHTGRQHKVFLRT